LGKRWSKSEFRNQKQIRSSNDEWLTAFFFGFRTSGLIRFSGFGFRFSPHGTSTLEIRVKTPLMPENVRYPPLGDGTFFKILPTHNGVSARKTRVGRSILKTDAQFVPEYARKCPKMPDFARRFPIDLAG